MMIIKAVHTLLFKYNCVIIPGFGGIVTNYRSAEIHPVKNTFSAPKKRLAFNENLVESDGLLASFIASENSISIADAENEISAYVKQIKNTIEKEGSILLDHIGVFSFNSEKRIQFKPIVTENYLEDSFGLPDLYFKPIEKQSNSAMHEVHSTPQKSPVPSRGPVKKEKLEEAKEKQPSKTMFLVIPILLVVGTLISMFVVKDHDGNMLMATLIPSLKSEIVAESEEEIVLEENIAAETEEVVAEEAHDEWAAAPAVVEEKHEDAWSSAPAKAVSASSGMKYHVIAGVFSKKSYAQRLANQYKGEVLKLDGYFKVSVARASSKDEADQKKASLMNELGNDIWVLEQ